MLGEPLGGGCLLGEPLGGGCSTPKISEIENQFSFCDAKRENLASAIEILEGKLNPVLRRIAQKGENPCEKDTEELTPLATSIKKIGKDMENFAVRIKSILERLEL